MNKKALVLLVALSVYLAFCVWTIFDYRAFLAPIRADPHADFPDPYESMWYFFPLLAVGAVLIGSGFYVLKFKRAFVLAVSVMIFMALVGRVLAWVNGARGSMNDLKIGRLSFNVLLLSL